MHKILLLLFISIFYILNCTFVFPVRAQDLSSLGIASYIKISEKDVKDGDIITSTKDGYMLSKTPYDPNVIGVITQAPAIVLNTQEEGSFPIVSNGQVVLNVTSANGTIKAGDPVTTSEVPGAAMKADKSGFILGTAQEDYSDSDPKKVGKIQVALNVHFLNTGKSGVGNSLKDVFSLSAIAATESPSAVFKYVIAAVILLISFVLGFVFFGRLAALGVEALGRNPKAKGVIQLGIFFNVLITIVIVLSGGVIAFFVIRL